MTAILNRTIDAIPSIDMTGDEWAGFEWADDGALRYKPRPNGEHEHACRYCDGEWDCTTQLRTGRTHCRTFEANGGYCSVWCRDDDRAQRERQAARRTQRTHRTRRSA